MTIYKYVLTPDHETVPLPKGARVLDAQMQDGSITLWALVDPQERESVPRRFGVYATGGPGPGVRDTHVATILHGGFVWHVFEVGLE
jgi:hypothetical protein